MDDCSRRSVLALAPALGMSGAVREEVAVTADLPDPLFDLGLATSRSGAPVQARIELRNVSPGPLRLVAYRAVLPELMGARGDVVPFSFGSNQSRIVRPSDYVPVEPGGVLAIAVAMSFHLRGDTLAWADGTGTMGFWRVSRTQAPYRFRLTYQCRGVPTPAIAQASPVPIWVGQVRSRTVALPAGFPG